jgi:acyl-CoA thioesterase
MTAVEIVNKMYQNDAFSQWLGINILEIGEGYCYCQMGIRNEMTNGFGIAHGGISYSFADSVLAFASNSIGQHSLSIETSISHTKAIKVGDVIFAKAILKTQSKKLGIYEVEVRNQDNEVVALFKGTVFIKDTKWE